MAIAGAILGAGVLGGIGSGVGGFFGAKAQKKAANLANENAKAQREMADQYYASFTKQWGQANAGNRGLINTNNDLYRLYGGVNALPGNGMPTAAQTNLAPLDPRAVNAQWDALDQLQALSQGYTPAEMQALSTSVRESAMNQARQQGAQYTQAQQMMGRSNATGGATGLGYQMAKGLAQGTQNAITSGARQTAVENIAARERRLGAYMQGGLNVNTQQMQEQQIAQAQLEANANRQQEVNMTGFNAQLARWQAELQNKRTQWALQQGTYSDLVNRAYQKAGITSGFGMTALSGVPNQNNTAVQATANAVNPFGALISGGLQGFGAGLGSLGMYGAMGGMSGSGGGGSIVPVNQQLGMGVQQGPAVQGQLPPYVNQYGQNGFYT